ncbi:glycosyltransferase [Neolewinella persica]|uniref:glycosyltransferase n=1 Tax=Neolewinella persica TaxID=70998 RepID=UPI00037732D6|nr:glycosyltransferase [Neolewinella persica]
MKYLLLSIGTRGDMEPFLAVGDMLLKAGHETVCVMPAQFQELAEGAGFPFEALDRRFLELIDGSAGRAIMGQKGSAVNRVVQLGKLAWESLSIQRDLVKEQRDAIFKHQPDRILYHPKCVFARAWGICHPGRAIVISPIPNWLHPVEKYPHIAINTNFGRRSNLLSYAVINYLTALMSARSVKAFSADFPGHQLNRKAIAKYMKEQERALYLVSPTLFPRPAYWPDQAMVPGYFERPKTGNWSPPAGLMDFLARFKDEHPTFITFGSMVNAAPDATTNVILSVLRKHQIPAIINTSSGGLIHQEDVPSHIHFVNNIPYEWIFPKVHSVVHHGGSGTTHTALKHQCASLIIPHIIDQFFWNKRVAALGAGPLGIKIKQLNETTFEQLILDLRSNVSYGEKAIELGQLMAGEASGKALLEELTR